MCVVTGADFDCRDCGEEVATMVDSWLVMVCWNPRDGHRLDPSWGPGNGGSLQLYPIYRYSDDARLDSIEPAQRGQWPQLETSRPGCSWDSLGFAVRNLHPYLRHSHPKTNRLLERQPDAFPARAAGDRRQLPG